ncbi:hypothetical protein SPI_04719 [Niveomyces insectorum RCEF 264]|uniref:Protein BCP1 n=1 Tax=Niveomyces insectorum RCEF 264 TaxID=1081102 RepID=A0A167USK3_9HYPO|nr:hypothetical protein SPI_04719 [Niveomyces insectorum RCEF 264]
MGKKRAREATGRDDRMKDADAGSGSGSGSGSDDDFDVVDVDFEWFNFDPAVDFHGTKSLLRQLLDVDAPLLDVSALAECVLAQPTIGSTVKVDGKETDAYALLTALGLGAPVQQAQPALSALAQYVGARAAASPDATLARVLPPLLAPAASAPSDAANEADEAQKAAHVGLVLSERLINMPAEIAPPLYTMLQDELEAAVEDGEPYAFTHYLVLSKAYKEVASSLEMVVEHDDGGDDDDDDGNRRKKKKKARTTSSSSADALFYFHPEDEVLRKHASASGTFAYANHDAAVADSKRAFQELGIQPCGLLILIEASRFAGAVEAVGAYLRPPQ